MADRKARAFHLIDNVYYVGTEEVSSHLFATSDGHILIDACCPGDGPAILDGIRQLGFDPGGIRYLLVSHAHDDHLGSAAFLAAETGATVCIGEADVAGAENGSTTQLGLTGIETFKVDMPLKEGDLITVGDISIRVYHTPGHTPGCCSFGFDVHEEGRVYGGALFGGPGTNVFAPENIEKNIYGGSMDDFFGTVRRLLTFNVDVWLGAHPYHNETFSKHAARQQGATPNPYIDPQGWRSFLDKCLAEAESYAAPAK
jgi:metallo-beta-lactamase class B